MTDSIVMTGDGDISVEVGNIGVWEPSIVPYSSYLDFPSVGNTYTLYIDKSQNTTYRWDDTDAEYIVVGSDYKDIELINGGNANGN